MGTWFDESRLDDPAVLAAHDHVLRQLAESGARVRRGSAEAAADLADAGNQGRHQERPRAVIAVGADSRLLRAVLEPVCPVPFVAWPGSSLPGWAGSLDLVVVLAPVGDDPVTAGSVAEAVRRGCQVAVACPPGSMVAEHASGRWTRLLPSRSGDQLAAAVLMLAHLAEVGLGPEVSVDEVAGVLDAVAVECSPHRDLAVNPAKLAAIALADVTPVVWGGSVLAARAARRIAESLRRATGRGAVAGDLEQVLPLVAAAQPRNVFDDPFDSDTATDRPVLVLLSDGEDSPLVAEQRHTLERAAAQHGVRIELLSADAGSEVARYASLLLQGRYTAAYLGLALTQE